MTNNSQDSTPHSSELDDVLAEYVSAEEAGTAPDRAAFLVRYPRHADELREFFTNRDQMRQLIRPLQGAVGQLVGKVRYFGDYELLEEVAAGGMGIVYKARQASLNRIVAVKMILKGTLAGEDDVKRFRSEAEAAASLQHPGIVAIHEVGLHKGQHYFSMDFVEGQSLADLVRDKPLSARKAAEYVREAAEAVQYAHEQGTLHRDLKPSNIMIDRQSRVRITDFGLAKRIEGNSNLTLSGQILGTPSYMPPEQALGKRSLIAAASDIYSLGAVLYELLAGRPPFRGESLVETLKQVETLDPVAPRLLNPATPADLETICLKCLEKEPHKRYGTAQLLADDLGRFLRGETILARPVGRVERSWRWCRRNPLVACLLTAVSISLVVGSAVSSYFAVQSKAFAVEADARAREAIVERDRADAKTAEALVETQRADQTSSRERLARLDADKNADRARRLLYVSDLNLAQQSWNEANVGRVLKLLGQHEPSAATQDLRGWEWHFLWKLCHSELRTLKGHSTFVQSVAFSPDGRQIVSGSNDQTIKLWDTESGAELATFKVHCHVTSVAFSPGGKQIASGGSDSTVKLWDAQSGVELSALKGHTRGVRTVAFSPDGKQIASGSLDSTIQLWDAAMRTELATIKGHAGAVLSVAFSPDGRQIASGSLDATIKLWDTTSGVELVTLKGHTSAINTIAFSPDGKRIASGSADNTIKLWDTASGAELLTLRGHARRIASVAFSPDGKRIVSASGDSTIKFWDSTSGAELAMLKGHDRGVLSVVFSPDGHRIASGGGDPTIKLWDAASVGDLVPFTGHADFITSVAFSPDGNRIASGSLDDNIKLWHTEHGVELSALKGHTGGVRTVAFSPDGKQIASGSNDSTIKLWDMASGTELATLKGHTGSVLSVTFSPDGSRIASGSGDNTVKLWDARSGAELITFKEHAREVLSVAFSPDGKRIASESKDNTLKLWDAESGAELATFKGASPISNIAFSPDGTRIALGSLDQTIKLWDVASGAELVTLKQAGIVQSVAFSSDGKRLVASSGRTICVYDATLLNEDEKMARFHVNQFFKETGSIDIVVAAIQRADGWNQAMRDAALSYARSRASTVPVSNADAKNP